MGKKRRSARFYCGKMMLNFVFVGVFFNRDPHTHMMFPFSIPEPRFLGLQYLCESNCIAPGSEHFRDLISLLSNQQGVYFPQE